MNNRLGTIQGWDKDKTGTWQGQDRGKTGTRHGAYREKKEIRTEIRQRQVNNRQGKDRDKIREGEGKKVGGRGVPDVGWGVGGVGEVREW